MPVLKRAALFLPVFFACIQLLEAQNLSSSPYSRYGVGDLKFNGLATNNGMGGVGYGMNQLFSMNLSNPAGNSGLGYTTYEVGTNLSFNELSTATARQKENNIAFNYFAFAFPIRSQKWSTGFGLTPFSSIGYSVRNQVQNDQGETETHTYKGSGGLNQFFLTSALKAGKVLNFGATASYLFGVINQDRTVEYENTNYLNTFIGNSTSVGWFYFSVGTQLNFDSLRFAPSDSMLMLNNREVVLKDSLRILEDSLHILPGGSIPMEAHMDAMKKELEELPTVRSGIKDKKAKSDWGLNIGIKFSPQVSLRASNSQLAYNFKTVQGTAITILPWDTTVNSEGEKGRIEFPYDLGFGLMVKKGSRWLIGTDLTLQNWSRYSSFGQPGQLSDSWQVSAGAQFIPDDRAFKSYFKQMNYRLGFHYSQSFLQFNGTHINETGISAGLGLPFRRVGTMIQLSLEAGQRGTIMENLIREKYIRFTLGLTINDRWFIKPKYD